MFTLYMPMLQRKNDFKSWIFPGIFLSLIVVTGNSQAASCLYVSSYHQGYEWNDGIERGLQATLSDKCKLDTFYLDTKRNKSETFGEQQALKAKRHIEKTKPDVIIAADDNASRYLIKPYYKDAAIPVVFCGINRTVEPYGYPYSNATGMVEIAPIKPMLNEIKKIRTNTRRAVYLAPDVVSQHKEFELNRGIYKKHNIDLQPVFVKKMADWEAAYIKAQDADLLIIGSNGGLNDWDEIRAHNVVNSQTRTFSVTNMDWMAPFAMFAMTKVAEEQGEWAGEVALSILQGQSPRDIPIVVNRRWNIYVNPSLLQKANVEIPDYLMHKAVKVDR